MILQKWENKGKDEIGLVTPTPGDLPTELLLCSQVTTSGTTSQCETCLICWCVGAWHQQVNTPQGGM